MRSEVFFKEIMSHFGKELPFVVYRKPNDSVINAMLQHDNNIYKIDDYSESGFVFAPFDDREDAILIPQDTSTQISLNGFSLDTICTTPKSSINDDKEKLQHFNLVKRGIDAIHNNKFLKVVLSRPETVAQSQENAITIFKRLLSQYPTAFVYCWFHPNIGLWLGASPETLLSVEGSQFKTMALAGTQLYTGTLDVNWHNKEKVEQQLVTDFIVNNLKDHVSTLHVSEPFTIKAGSLIHIKTQIRGTLASSLKQILFKLHPTPAVCGMPKLKAKSFIIANEKYDREFYTGFFGELNLREIKSRNSNKRNIENNAYGSIKKVSKLFVNLRCMQLKNNKAYIYVGGGITKDSIPENEWLETVNKTQTIKSVLD